MTKLFLLSALFSVMILSSFAQQKSKIDSLNQVLKISKEDTDKTKVYGLLAQEYEDSDPSKAIVYADKGLELASKLNFKKGISVCLNSFGNANDSKGEFKKALSYYERRFKIVTDLKDSLAIAGAYDNIGVIYFKLGNSDSCIELRKKANDIYKNFGKEKNIANGLLWIGNAYKDKSDYKNALSNYILALRLHEKNNDTLDCAFDLVNISSIYRYYKQYQEAKKYVIDAKMKFSAVKNQRGIGFSLYRLALIFNEDNQIDSSTKALLEAKKIFEKINDKNTLALIQSELGDNYLLIHNFKLALENYNEALLTVNETGDKNLKASIVGSIGVIYKEEKEYLKALEYLNISKQLFEELGNKQSLKDISNSFVEIYINLKSNKALEYFETYKQLSDTIYNIQSFKAASELNTKYETEKKDQQIILQKKDTLIKTAEINRQNTIVKSMLFGGIALLIVGLLAFLLYRNTRTKKDLELKHDMLVAEMKSLRSQMNPHFIFNSLQSIQSFILEKNIKDADAYLLKFSKLMRLVLENSQSAEVPLKEDIQALELYMQLESLRLNHPFTYSIKIDKTIDDEQIKIPPLILQPFVENSIWHGLQYKEGPGHIDINIVKSNNILVCTIEDNGVGRSFSKPSNFSNQLKNKSVGIKLTEERLKILNETKKIETKLEIIDKFNADNKAVGTIVKVSLPALE